ncbi:hypothetical protein Poli38472_012101 [Pythium oligandrum]|uniref:Uncharacterized protein n=1 Tax=Pythium oligandrum TaxID=41045 RepID=A0A8K1CP95_PYTOL|nr:hypothetical protein Poli38472_012101 [Pythium oligandrum]|eukprot:TMW66985.1 hypothetical protein Poli38472_012101 [Pythium oligandrum]
MPSLRAISALSVALMALAMPSAQAAAKWNQTSNYDIEVSTTDWSNYDGENGGCVTCPYTCVKRSTGPTGTSLNLSNATSLAELPAIYTQPVSNGCCYASKGDSTVMPNCNQEANPAKAEACGFLYGPSLKWRIGNALKPPTKSVKAILFASIDCENFWAVGQNPIRYTSNTKTVSGSKQINGGCYGDPSGVSMVLAGCLTSELKFDKAKTYPWDQLAAKCLGLNGKCVITNGIWGEHLKCCSKSQGLTSDWNKKYKLYTATAKTSVHLSGPAITAIVIGGVALLMCLVHFGSKARDRARQTALLREQEATDDYEEIMTPLVNGNGEKRPAPLQRPIGPATVEVSLHEGDQIFRKKEPELLYEGDMF